jgi:hypothetical protein
VPGKGLALDIASNRPALPDARWVVQVVDDASRVRKWAVTGDKVSAAAACITQLKAWLAETETLATWVRCDNGTDINVGAIETFCRSHGIRFEPTPTYSPEQDGVAERGFRSVFTKARSAMIDSGIPQEYWRHIVEGCFELMNHTASKAVVGNRTPVEVLSDHVLRNQPRLLPPDLVGKRAWPATRPNLDWIRILGTKVVVRIVNNKAGKTEARGESGIFVGFQGHHLYKVALEGSGKIVISRDVKFYEELWANDPAKIIKTSLTPGTFRPRRGGELPDQHRRKADQDQPRERPAPDAEQSSDDELAGWGGEGSTEDSNHDLTTGLTLANWDVNPFGVSDSVFGSLYVVNPDTPTQLEAMTGPDKELWAKADAEEIKMLLDRGTFIFGDKSPVGADGLKPNVIDSRMVRKRKKNSDQVVTRHKSRMVARGFRQREGVDFDECYASTAKSASWRMLLAMATARGWAMIQMDAVGAYLLGELHHEIFMRVPPWISRYMTQYPAEAAKHGFAGQPVMKLGRPLYGLRQAGFE